MRLFNSLANFLSAFMKETIKFKTNLKKYGQFAKKNIHTYIHTYVYNLAAQCQLESIANK